MSRFDLWWDRLKPVVITGLILVGLRWGPATASPRETEREIERHTAQLVDQNKALARQLAEIEKARLIRDIEFERWIRSEFQRLEK